VNTAHPAELARLTAELARMRECLAAVRAAALSRATRSEAVAAILAAYGFDQ